MTLIDIIIILVLIGAALAGFRQGFVLEIATIFGVVVALGVARLEYTDIRHLLSPIGGHSPWLTVVAYLLVFLVVWAAVILVARRIRWLVRLLLLGWADRVGGAIIGLIQGAVVVEMLLYLGVRLPNAALHHAIKHAALTPTFLHLLPMLHRFFPHV